jgi:GNAT superfamily N-acetyltransferase
MAELPEVRSARHEEADRLAATLTLAFSSDPVARWAWPDANQFARVLMPLVGPFGGRAALDRGTAHVVGDFLGAALWVPPGAHVDDEAIGEIFAKNIEQPRLSEIYALFEKMAEHHPPEPHWYLPLIGIDPAYQRRGLGSALLQHGLAVCDRDQTLAYLESTSPASVPLYQRHGFEVIGEIVVSNSPPMFPMLRRPQ